MVGPSRKTQSRSQSDECWCNMKMLGQKCIPNIITNMNEAFSCFYRSKATGNLKLCRPTQRQTSNCRICPH